MICAYINLADSEFVCIRMRRNFTDFSDDLTDLSFDHRGTFLSFTGAL